MRKLTVLAVVLALSSAAYADKPKEKKEVVLKVVPVAPPKPIVTKEESEFDKQMEALKRQFKLLELKLKIEKIKAEMEKLQNQSLQLPNRNSRPAQVSVPTPAPVQVENPELKLREKMLQIKLQQQQERLLSAKLSYLQNLFTGVVEVNGKRIAFDSAGRKYTVGSFVEGFRIEEILPDGVVVSGTVGGTPITYKVPISSSVDTGKKNSYGASQPASATDYSPAPIETAPVPIGG